VLLLARYEEMGALTLCLPGRKLAKDFWSYKNGLEYM